MKSAKKKKVLKALETVGDLLVKCGGPGGTPGPCPSGGGKPSGSGRQLEGPDSSRSGFPVAMRYAGGLWGNTKRSKKLGSEEVQEYAKIQQGAASSERVWLNSSGAVFSA